MAVDCFCYCLNMNEIKGVILSIITCIIEQYFGLDFKPKGNEKDK